MFAELAGLVGFAIVSPVLGSFGGSPESFTGVDASPGEIIAFGLLVAFAPLVVLGGVAAATRALGPRARGWVQTALVSVLAAVAVVVVVRELGLAAPGRVLVAVVVAGGVGWLHRRWEPGRSFLRFASPSPLLFLVLFVFASSVAPLVRPGDPGTAAVASAAGPAPVVMIVLDELPTFSVVAEGEIDADQFPNLARLAETSTWYRNHTTVADHTMDGMPAITTGRLPSGDGFATADTYPESIFTLLGRTHHVGAVEWSTQLCPSSLCDGEQPEMDEDAAALIAGPVAGRASPLRQLGDEAVSLWWDQAAPWAEPPEVRFDVVGFDDAAEVARPSLEFLSGLTESEGDRPTFDYAHVPVPHQPWLLLPTGQTYNGPLLAGGLRLRPPEEVVLQTRARHLLQAQWTDRWLGAVIDRLQELDRWDDAVVVVTADHGVSFDPEAPGRDLLPGNEVEIAWTPLLIKAPGQSDGEVRDDDAQTIDILPTVADLAGVDLPWDADGSSLADGAVRAGRSKTVRLGDRTGRHPDAPDRLVELSTDGLSAILEAPPRPGEPDELQLWRHGRHGDLLGQGVDDLGECSAGPPVSYQPPDGWSELRHEGRAPLPLWHEGTVKADGDRDVAVAVDGKVVGWSVSRPIGGEAALGILLAAPLIDDTPGHPVLYEVVDGDGCRLKPLPVEG